MGSTLHRGVLYTLWGRLGVPHYIVGLHMLRSSTLRVVYIVGFHIKGCSVLRVVLCYGVPH